MIFTCSPSQELSHFISHLLILLTLSHFSVLAWLENRTTPSLDRRPASAMPAPTSRDMDHVKSRPFSAMSRVNTEKVEVRGNRNKPTVATNTKSTTTQSSKSNHTSLVSPQKNNYIQVRTSLYSSKGRCQNFHGIYHIQCLIFTKSPPLFVNYFVVDD